VTTSNEVVMEKAINPYQLEASKEADRYKALIIAGVTFPPKLFQMYEIKGTNPSWV
jgi:hypothetical protein